MLIKHRIVITANSKNCTACGVFTFIYGYFDSGVVNEIKISAPLSSQWTDKRLRFEK